MDERETQIAALFRAGETKEAYTAVVRAYGPEIFGFLVAVVRSHADAEDVFAQVCERLWLKLPMFRWECSLRTWCYVLARRTLHDFLRTRTRATRRWAPISDVVSVPAPCRTSTRPYLRTERRKQLEDLRAKLSPEEHALLILRVDRQLSWKDLALAFSDKALEGDDLNREAARLRQRYRTLRLKLHSELRALAPEEGG